MKTRITVGIIILAAVFGTGTFVKKTQGHCFWDVYVVPWTSQKKRTKTVAALDVRYNICALPGYYTGERTGTRATFFGESLDDTQEFNLLHKGIEPDGYEVIYIDETGKHLAEAPSPISREDIIRELTLPPDGFLPMDGPLQHGWSKPSAQKVGQGPSSHKITPLKQYRPTLIGILHR